MFDIFGFNLLLHRRFSQSPVLHCYGFKSSDFGSFNEQ